MTLGTMDGKTTSVDQPSVTVIQVDLFEFCRIVLSQVYMLHYFLVINFMFVVIQLSAYTALLLILYDIYSFKWFSSFMKH